LRLSQALIVVGVLAIGFINFRPWLVAVGFAAIFLATLLFTWERLCERAILKCPHCGNPPLKGARGSPQDAEFCAYCFYWLAPPFGPGSNRSQGGG